MTTVKERVRYKLKLEAKMILEVICKTERNIDIWITAKCYMKKFDN